MAAATYIAAAVPRIRRVWKDVAAQPGDSLRLYRRWADESVMVRAVALERQEMPEHKHRTRWSQLRRYHDRIRRCCRRQVAAAWNPMPGERIGELAKVGSEIAGYWMRVYRARP